MLTNESANLNQIKYLCNNPSWQIIHFGALHLIANPEAKKERKKKEISKES